MVYSDSIKSSRPEGYQYFNPSWCFGDGARRNRIALECDKEWEVMNV